MTITEQQAGGAAKDRDKVLGGKAAGGVSSANKPDGVLRGRMSDTARVVVCGQREREIRETGGQLKG